MSSKAKITSFFKPNSDLPSGSGEPNPKASKIDFKTAVKKLQNPPNCTVNPLKTDKWSVRNGYEWVLFTKEGIWCKICYNFRPPGVKTQPFIDIPCKLGGHESDRINSHNLSKNHATAITNFESNFKRGTVIQQSLAGEELELAENSRFFLTLLNNSYFLFKKKLPHHSLSNSLMDYLEYISAKYWDSDFLERVRNRLKANANYRSVDILSEVLSTVSHYFSKQIENEVKEASFWSLIADETSDIKVTEQLVAVLRFFKGGKLYEKYGKLISLPAQDHETITKALQNFVAESTLSWNNCVGLGFDGANVMSSKKNGVRGRLQRESASQALYVHCKAHNLSLVMKHSAAENGDILRSFQALDELARYFHNSSKRTSKLKQAREVAEISGISMPQPCPTRWSYSDRLVNAVIKLLRPLFLALGELASLGDSAALGHIATMSSFTFFSILTVCREPFDALNKMSIALQAKNTDFSKLEILLISTINSIKESKNKLDEQLDEAEELEGTVADLITEHGFTTRRAATARRNVRKNLE